MAAMNRSLRTALERDRHRATPPFNAAEREPEPGRLRHRDRAIAVGYRYEDRVDQTQRFERLVEADRHPRGDVAVGVSRAANGERFVGRRWKVCAQILRDAARAGG